MYYSNLVTLDDLDHQISLFHKPYYENIENKLIHQ